MSDRGIHHHQTHSETSSSSSSSSSMKGGAMLDVVAGPPAAVASPSSSSQEQTHPKSPLMCKNGGGGGGGAGASSDGVVDSPLHKALHSAAALASFAVGAAFVPDYKAVVQAVDSGLLPIETTQTPAAVSTQGAASKPPPATPPFKPEDKNAAEDKNATKKRKGKKSSLVIPHQPIVPLHNPYASNSAPSGLPSLMHLPGIGAPGGLPPPSFAGFHPMAPKGADVPLLFRDRPLRRGKWTREEEAYAKLLIELFEKGQIDEKNGSTLRSFLSRKLHCPPMRISKKYAGTGIGKMVFLSKNGFGGVGEEVGSPAYNSNIQRLQQAESNFYKRCFPDMAMLMPLPNLRASPQPHGLLPFPPQLNLLLPLHPSNVVGGALPNIQPGSFVLHQPPQRPPSYWVPPSVNAVAAVPPLNSATMTMPPQADQGGQNHRTPTPSAPVPAVALVQAKAPLTARQTLEQAYLSVANTIQQENAIVTSVMVPSVPAAASTHTPVQQQRTPTPALTAAGNDMPDFLSGFDNVAGGQGNSSDQNASATTFNSEQYSPTFTSRSFDDFHRLLGKTLTPEVKRQVLDRLSVPALPFANNNPPSSSPKEVPPYFSMPGAAQAVVPSTVPVRHGLDFSSSMGSAAHTAGTGTQTGGTIANHNAPMLQPQQQQQHYHQVPQQQHHLMLTKAYGDALSMAAGAATTNPLGAADSYSLFAQQSAFAASQHSAYTSTRSDDAMSLSFGEDMVIPQLQESAASRNNNNSNDNNATRNHNGATTNLAQQHMTNAALSAVPHNPNLVSEPSNASDQGSDETQEYATSGSGTDNQADGSSSNDSDGSNSESSRKRRRTDFYHHQQHPGRPASVDDPHHQEGANHFYGTPNDYFGGNFR